MFDLLQIKSHKLDDNEMNTDLYQLYTDTVKEHGPRWWAHYQRQADPEYGDYPANPYLLSAPDYYLNSDKRIMFVGQETNSWGGEFGDCGAYHPERGVTELMSLYDICLKKKAISTLLWRFGRRIESQIGIPFIFNNIAKVGWCGKKGFSALLQPHILSQEISILKPDILILATGPTAAYMNELAANGIIPSTRLPLLSCNGYHYVEEWNGVGIRTVWCCHPNYLQRKSVMDNSVKAICDFINNDSRY